MNNDDSIVAFPALSEIELNSLIILVSCLFISFCMLLVSVFLDSEYPLLLNLVKLAETLEIVVFGSCVNVLSIVTLFDLIFSLELHEKSVKL